MLLSIDTFTVLFRRYDGLFHQRDTLALDGLSFGIERGEMLALIGESGAGKSLLGHALFGILPVNALTSGRIQLGGEELNDANRRNYCGRRIGLVPQSVSYLDPLVRCGTQLAWAAARSGKPVAANSVNEGLDQFGLERSVARLFPHQLSGGMARRLMLAMATIGKPELVVADEPTSGLDPENAGIVLDQLRRLADTGTGVLLITHDLSQALPSANRVALLKGGRLMDVEPASSFSGDGSALRTSYARAFWCAMPDNDFATESSDYA